MRNAKPLLVLGSVLTSIVLGTGGAAADESKPKVTPAQSVSLEFKKIEFSYKTDGSPGPSVIVSGAVHLVSQALISENGVPIGFTLHSNLANVGATSTDGAESYVAAGTSDAIPAECGESDACAPPFWVLTFRLIPEGLTPRPSLFFDVTVITQYADDGTLVNACIVEQQGCEEIIP
jgi:hypothetical protein